MASPGTEIAAVRTHLVQALGPPLEVLELSGSPDKKLAKLEVATWTPAGPTGPMILVSCGMSRLQTPEGRRLEALLLIRPAPSKDELAALVKLVGRFGLLVAGGTARLGPGTVIRAPDEMAPLSSMPNLVLLPPLTFPPPFRQLKRSDQQAVDLVWLAPVHETESQIVEAHGGEALVLQLNAYAVDLASWRREAIPRMLTLDEAKAMIIARSPPPPETAKAEPKTKDERVAQLKATALERAARVASQTGGPPPAPASPVPRPPPALAGKPRSAIDPLRADLSARRNAPPPKPVRPVKK